MPYNNQNYSDAFYETLYELGVYAQPGGSVAISDRLPRTHIDDQYIVVYATFNECVSYLESELDELVSNFTAIWNTLEAEIEEELLEKPNHHPKINEDLTFSFVNSLISIADHYEDLEEVSEKLVELKRNLFFASDSFRERLGFYSILLQSMDAEMLGENQRLLVLKYIQETNQDSQITDMLKYAYYSPWGMEEGIGPRGRNNPLTPFGGYDYYYDRVMDGTDIHDYSGGHATEKFIGRDGYNKFKKYPHLLRPTKLRLRTKPLRYLSRKQKRKLRKNKRKRKNVVSPTGLVRTELRRDPGYYYWWDEQRNNPYLEKNKGESGVYPTWDSFR